MFNSGIRGKRATDNQATINPQTKFIQTVYPQPYISGYAISGKDDTALDPAGGQTVLVNGTGFATGVSATLAGTQIASVTLVSSTQISFTSPAKAGGSYSLLVYNSTGGAAILVPGLTYSSVPTYTTAAGSIGSFYETTPISTSVLATSDSAITYSLSSGSLPSGATLYGNGVITGTSPVDSSSTTYTFDITATDVELQDVTRTFTLTINTDVVSWSTPGAGTNYTVVGNSPISNVALSATSAAGYGVTYAANALPTGITLSGSTISGTPTVEQTVSTLLTATANTSSRTSTRTISWTVTLGDTYWKYTSLLLSATTPTTTFINDASLNNNQLTIFGDTKPNNFNPYQEGYYSNFFDGTGDYLSAPANAAFQLTGDFTVEAWVYMTTINSFNMIFGADNGASSDYFVIRSTTIELAISNAAYPAWSFTFATGVWYHVAVTRNSNTLKAFVNGTQLTLAAGSATNSSQYFQSSVAMLLGRYGNTSTPYYFTGYISNARIVKGTAVYTSNFTPPTSPLTAIANTSLLTCQSNRLIDDSINNFTITKVGDTRVSPAYPFSTPTTASYNTLYSTSFDGTGDYLTLSNNTLLGMGSGNFTIEFWMYQTALSNYRQILDVLDGNSVGRLILWVGSDGTLTNLGQSGNQRHSTASGAIVINTWTHVALVRSSGTTKFYINGTQSGSNYTDSTNYTCTTGTVYIGINSDGSTYPYIGYLSNFRMVKGTAVYTSAFTPPTTSLTAIANTSLLTCQNATLIDNSTNNFTITSFNQAQPIPVSPFTMTTSNVTVTSLGSAYFDGTGDYITWAAPAKIPTSTSAWTIEFWFNTSSSTASNQGIFRFGDAAYSSMAFVINSGNLYIDLSTSGSSWSWSTGAKAFTLNQWNHVALVRNGSTTTAYLNGVSYYSTTSVTLWNPSAPLFLGTEHLASNYYPGYIADVHIIDGTAKYTSNFTPPQTPLTAITNTQLLTCQYNGGANNNGFIDQSSFNNIIARNGNTTQGTFSPYSQNGWSNYFDGVGNYLSLADNTSFDFGAGNFTIEYWINLPNLTNAAYIYGQIASNTTLASRNVYDTVAATTGVISSRAVYGSTTLTISSIAGVQPGVWTHVAFVRDGVDLRQYINGVQQGTASISTNSINNSTTTFSIGRWGEYSSTGATCNLSNFRIVKGRCLYPNGTSFPPSTSPLTAVADTVLLTCQSNGFVDNSPNNQTITVVGTPSIQAFSPFGGVTSVPTSYSAYMDGTGYVISPASGSANISPVFGLGADNYTVELWVWLNNDTSVGIWDFRYSGGGSGLARPNLIYSAGTSILFSIGGTAKITYNVTLTQYTWYHFAVVRISGVTTLYVDGIARGTYSGTEDFSSANTFTIGTVGDSPGYATTELTGYVSNVRIVRGIGVYTGAFTVPTSPLQLTQSSGTNISAISTIPVTGNSVYFDGTGDYLTAPANAAFTFGTGDFTVESWVYYNNKTNSGIFQIGSSVFPGTNGIGCGLDASTNWLLYYGNGSQTAAGTGPTNGVWYHVATVRQSGVTKVYINGTQTISVTDTADYTGTYLGIAGIYSGSYVMNGYISNFRIVKGTAVYTSAFTPPTSPLTAIANTSLLTCQSAILQDNSTNNFTITSFGNAVVAKSWSPFGYNTSYLGFQSFDAKDVSVNLVGQTITGNVYPRNVNPFGITNTTSVSYTPSVNGGSMYFDGSGDNLVVTSNPSNNIGSNNFTLEWWMYPTNLSAANQSLFFTGTGNLVVLMVSGTGVIQPGNYQNTGIVTPSTGVKANAWTHVAITKTGSVWYVYYNGVQAGSNTNYAFSSSTSTFTIGTGASPYYGYLSDYRLTISAVLYSSNFYPGSAPATPATTIGATTYNSNLLLSGTSGGIIDYHGTNDLETVGNAQLAPQDPYGGSYYSNYFDGTGDYLSVSTGTIAIGTGDLTLECWGYRTSTTTLQSLVNINAYNTGILIRWETTKVTIYVGGTDYSYNTPTDIPLNSWVHIALVRSGGVFKFYVNGTQATTFNSSYSLSVTSVTIGTSSHDTSDEFYGYISNVRLVNSAIYTTTFTPSTTPLTAISGTSLLTCQSNSFKDNSTNAFTITRNGDTKVQSVNPFQQNTGKSIYFDGTGDYLSAPSNAVFGFGTGNFTLECWIYVPSPADTPIYEGRVDGNSSLGFTLTAFNSTVIRIFCGSVLISATVANYTNQWTHVAVVKNSGTTTLYVNGVSGGTTASLGNLTDAQPLIGAGRYTSSTSPSAYMNGYIKDLRITKGIARYTATFTPPTTPFITN